MAEKKKRWRSALRFDKKREGERALLPPNRFGLFWDLLKGRFGRLILVNLLVLLFLAPVIVLVIFRNLTISAQDLLGPFGAGLGVGYPAFPDVVGYAERSVFLTDILYFALLIPASLFAALGAAGGGYLVRTLIISEGIFSIKDFFRGIKECYFSALEGILLFTTLLFLVKTVANLVDWYVALGSLRLVFAILSKVVGYLVLALSIPLSLWMIACGVSYKGGAFTLLKNAVAMTIGTFPQSVLFSAIAICPIFLVLFVSNRFLLSLGLVFYLLIGFSWCLMVFLNFSQWAFDEFVDPNYVSVPAKRETEESPAEKRRILLNLGRSRLAARPIEPLDRGKELYVLPETYFREDLLKLKRSREEIFSEVKAFEDAHKYEERYAEYTRQFENRERALENEKKKAPKKPPKMLNKR